MIDAGSRVYIGMNSGEITPVIFSSSSLEDTMFAANFLNELSSKYENNIKRLRNRGRPRVEHQSKT